jgi:ArsR family metal-binding transcriptional regulator
MKIHLLISSYDLELVEPPCSPGAATWSAKAHLQDDITEVLPYLNAELKGASYNHDSTVLIWEAKGKKYAFRPHEIAAAPVEVAEEGRKVISDLVDIVNEIWERRQEIRPDFEQRKLPTLMDIYRLLPKSNCKECGYPTCMGYAADLRTGKTRLSQCPNLSGENKDILLHLVDESVC